ncbi:zinc finger MYM-type protein 1-like [Harmonia axyridis]|uniref:zinc finger MYM-type protein 1-like n=1 Tax=Harmonia axyridis TaxID=115357 RepID=UPI001E277680|nr:zinc finger MYM-type protein 1-like [Harmonia axyridis]
MSYHHKSGSQKRKEQQQKLEHMRKGRKTLENLGFTTSKVTPGISKVNETCDEVSETSNISSPGPVPSPSSPISSSSVGQNDDLLRSGIISNAVKVDSNQDINMNIDSGVHFDIGNLRNVTPVIIEEAVRKGPEPIPSQLPPDSNGMPFPKYLLNLNMKNGEVVSRDWLTWSSSRQALFCFPCRLFNKATRSQHSSRFVTEYGWSPTNFYRKLYNRIPEHENSIGHRSSYLEWRGIEQNIFNKKNIDNLVLKSLEKEKEKWKELLQRFLQVILFLSERGLALRGSSSLIGNPNNGNFLGILELLANHDTILAEHLDAVKDSQETKKRMQVHYLSAEIQNEFISLCAEHVMEKILNERKLAKYFSLIVDATPDSSHDEQTTFILRYVWLNEDGKYQVFERFLEFINCNKKTGEDIANMILENLKKRNISIEDCRGQGYDNGSNMSGQYKGVQARILALNTLAIWSPCACHSLNLCGVHAAECCPQAVTFFGIIQKLYNIFSASPSRWEILKNKIDVSLHSLSTTRWSARVESVKPVYNKLPGIKDAILEVFELNLTSEVRVELNGILSYLGSFECLLMASTWLKVLTAINYRSVILQTESITLDIGTENLKSLLEDLNIIRNSWSKILNECREVAKNLEMSTEMPTSEKRKRKRKQFFDETNSEQDFSLELSGEDYFRINVFYSILDAVILNISTRFQAIKNIVHMFSVLWKFLHLEDADIEERATNLQIQYHLDTDCKLTEEIKHLKPKLKGLSATFQKLKMFLDLP